MPEPALQDETLEVATLFGIDYYFDDRSYIMSEMKHKAQAWTRFLRWAAEKQKDPEPFEGFWTVKVPTTQEDLLNKEDEQVQQIIFQIRSSTSIPNNQRLANRLVNLFYDAKEEDPDQPGISVGSLRSFYYILKEYTNLKYPIITLTPDNNIYASWEDEQNRLFSIHFLPNGITNFVIFKPNARHQEQTTRLSGITTYDDIMQTAVQHGVNDWIFE